MKYYLDIITIIHNTQSLNSVNEYVIEFIKVNKNDLREN